MLKPIEDMDLEVYVDAEFVEIGIERKLGMSIPQDKDMDTSSHMLDDQ